jgi:hypothetical protein
MLFTLVTTYKKINLGEFLLMAFSKIVSLSSQEEHSVFTLECIFTKKNGSTDIVSFSRGICRKSMHFVFGKIVFPRLNDVTLSS